jgi:hypothetical protein
VLSVPSVLNRAGKESFVIDLHKSALLTAAVAGWVALTPLPAHAQWWSTGAPVDFEECADRAEKAPTKEAKASELAACDAKFAGRRKAGGGYTYYDFMQNRSFDIAGPNPTPAEQKHIDEQYTSFLDKQRRGSLSATLTEKQEKQEKQQREQASLPKEKTSPNANTAALLPPEAPNKPKAAAVDVKSRAKKANCAKHSTFSCEWPVLSEKIENLKKALFGASQTKDKRS